MPFGKSIGFVLAAIERRSITQTGQERLKEKICARFAMGNMQTKETPMLNLEYCKKCSHYADSFYQEKISYCLKEAAELGDKKFNVDKYGYVDQRTNAYLAQPQFLMKPPDSCIFLLEQTLS